MANKNLKSIKFPGLTDTYVVPQVDNTLTQTGRPADAKATGDAISELGDSVDGEIDALKEDSEQTYIEYEEGIIPEEASKNLAIKASIIEGYWYHNVTGKKTPITDSNPYAIFPLISVEGGATYTTQGIQLLTYYDSNKTFLSYEEVASTYQIQHTMPSNASFVGITTRKTWDNIVGFYKGVYVGEVTEGEKFVSKRQVKGLTEDLKNKIPYEVGKNLFDASGEFTKIKTGYYRGYASGTWIALTGYEVAQFEVEGGTDYAVNQANIHVCFFSDTDASVYIGGFLSSATNGYTFTTPNDAKSMSVSLASASADTFQIEYGTSSTTYQQFKKGISANKIIGTIDGTFLHVGTGRKYTTIQAAVNDASDGDTIIIDAGVYVEAVDMVGKTLHLIGAGKDATIVTYSGDDYYYPPLEAARGLIENMSFITTATQKAEGAIDTAYCVHIDFDAEINGALQFVNCYFESPIRPTVGIGLRENFTLNFTDCIFKSSAFPVYFHEQQANNKTGQRIEFVNCTMQRTNAGSAIHMQESREYSGNEITVLFQRCIAKSNGTTGDNIISAATYPNNLTPTGNNYKGLNYFYLDTMSALNNENILNA